MLATVHGIPATDGPIDLAIAPGDVILVRGPNGSGKSSLLRALAGLDASSPLAPRSVERNGAGGVGFSMQDPRGALVGLTVEGEMRLRRRTMPSHLAPLAERDIATLSSGEARRVSLAIADGAAPLTLLDEPTEGLDADGRARLLALVRAARAAGRAVVAADHGGLLDALATRTIDLGPRIAAPLARIPRLGGPPVLVAPAARVRDLGFPALEMPAEFHALVGPNGSGKTTWLRHLAGLDAPGPVRPFAPANARATFARASVAEEIARADPRVRDLLVGAHLHARHPLTLSGGEAQRVSLAKALGRGGDVVLLDEPEAHLDAPGRAALADAIALRVREGACVLAATHDARVAALAHRTIALEARSA